jgi:hypothetical protein
MATQQHDDKCHLGIHSTTTISVRQYPQRNFLLCYDILAPLAEAEARAIFRDTWLSYRTRPSYRTYVLGHSLRSLPVLQRAV